MGDGEILKSTKHFTMIVPGWDLSLTPTILLRGEWEPSLTNYLLERIKPGAIAVDIGANLGWFSCLFASRGANVHAFEPNPKLQRILRKNIFMNAGNRAEKCSVNQCALSDREGVIDMRFPEWLSGGANLHDFDQTIYLDPMSSESTNIKVVTLDQHLARAGVDRVDFIKIDVEGFEESALMGAERTIDNSPNLVLCMEYTRGKYSKSFPEWLFDRFERAYVPAFKSLIDLQFLKDFENGKAKRDGLQLDIVFHTRRNRRRQAGNAE